MRRAAATVLAIILLATLAMTAAPAAGEERNCLRRLGAVLLFF